MFQSVVSKPLCRYGSKCFRKASCHFHHPPDTTALCRYGSTCKKQASCRFQHPPTSSVPTQIPSTTSSQSENKENPSTTKTECPICCEHKQSVATTSCCHKQVCYSCVKTILVTKDSLVKELTSKWLGVAHQCPKCSYGPIEHFACSDLTTEGSRNSCPKCRFFSPKLDQWDKWNGVLPPGLRVMEGHFPCPFCRADSAVSSAFGKGTLFCTKCKKMGHEKKDCTYIECKKCGKPGHFAKDCGYKQCTKCKKMGHEKKDCTYIQCKNCGKGGHLAKECTYKECKQCGKVGHLKKDCTNVVCSVCKRRGHRASNCRFNKKV